ncbi:MAG: hypothetical protein ACPGYK_02635 [Flavobacteriales bacterium]
MPNYNPSPIMSTTSTSTTFSISSRFAAFAVLLATTVLLASCTSRKPSCSAYQSGDLEWAQEGEVAQN